MVAIVIASNYSLLPNNVLLCVWQNYWSIICCKLTAHELSFTVWLAFIIVCRMEKEANSIFIVMWVYSVANIDWNVVGFRHNSKELCNRKYHLHCSDSIEGPFSVQQKIDHTDSSLSLRQKKFCPRKKVTAHGFEGDTIRATKTFFPFF